MIKIYKLIINNKKKKLLIFFILVFKKILKFLNKLIYKFIDSLSIKHFQIDKLYYQ